MASPTRRAWRITGASATCLAVLLGTTVLWSGVTHLAVDRETQSETYDHAVDRVELDLDEGAIRIAAGAPGQVAVERRLEWSGERPTVEETWHGDTLRITARCRKSAWSREHCAAGYTLTVPADVEIDARTRTSRIEVRGLTGDLRLSGSSGDVTLTDTSGRVRVTTGAGAITATGLRDGPVEVHANSGDVHLRFAAAPETVRATTAAGNVDIAVPRTDAYRVSVETADGDREVSVRQDSAATRTIAVRTTRGDVKITQSR
ncbi:DUF4097 family beta strand repeat-containing protein [Cryptosporangium aurantiacum]|uniref:Putative adhesin n=1 Tax=Cryptosporangium aurantiacum TaxID=134849 RepID=A0A1M7RLX6_9ACTN|nr:DUF4097 family beta strand repeat-containing protein [Cryptosporangium aurantiacum]SHN47180.1 Putative adhesin [Cryptosporangium aurantiacum]